MMQKTVHVCEWCGKESVTLNRYNFPHGWLSLSVLTQGNVPTAGEDEQEDREWQPLQEPGWNVESMPRSVVVCSTACARNYLIEVDKFLAEFPERRMRLMEQNAVGGGTYTPMPAPDEATTTRLGR